MDQADDLKAFERRMIEIISSVQPVIWRWRFLLFILILCTLITFYFLITDVSFSLISSNTIPNDDVNNDTSYISFISSKLFCKEISFSLSFCLLILAFLSGIHRKMFARTILIERFRYILADYNMSCDSKGRLLIKPRTTITTNGC